MSSSSPRAASISRGPTAHDLRCMEIVGGNRAFRDRISSPGMDIWVHCRPAEGNVGGDIHYFSMCGSGRVMRLAVADVAGHGPGIQHIARWLRRRMRRYINVLDQTRFARAINLEFSRRHAKDGRFATVLLGTYFAPTDHFIVCNAGHPPPLWFSTALGRWQRLTPEAADPGPPIARARATYRLARVSNLPLGVVQPTEYHQFAVRLYPGDMVLVYTDGLAETRNPKGGMLGDKGLLQIVREIPRGDPAAFGRALLAEVDRFRHARPPTDDETLIVLYHNASDPPAMTLGQAVRSLARMIGLRRV